MEPRDLIELLELSAGQTDHLMTRLIAELKERGAILEDLAALQLRQVASQQANASVIVEAAMTAGTLNSTSQLLGRMYGGSIQ
ncbi:hypothetical protein HF272_13595 [Rhizobium leguminosarum]|uniref:hypothetical protein n=1 Tax=Rhizobium leguminosarum TaxID=384 RepID=UPI001C927573|nr:hypothetical protein [Rhizobium leguminosarum]MBY2992463.1 hypothetical protein [Rhizobium leguminosarum]